MVDAQENVSKTIKREFEEEALGDGVDKELTEKLFSDGVTVYQDYIDDPRNTDNAWIETVAMSVNENSTRARLKNMFLFSFSEIFTTKMEL